MDDTKSGEIVNGIKVVCDISNIDKYYESLFDKLIVCVGYKHLNFRERLFNQLQKKYDFYTFIHSSVVFGENVQVGDGSIIFPGTVLDNGVEIGPNTLLNTGVKIAHDSKIVMHGFLAPGVTLAGFVEIGVRCFIGVGTNVIDNVTICNDTFVGGSLVLRDIEEPGVYVCKNNAKIMKLD